MAVRDRLWGPNRQGEEQWSLDDRFVIRPLRKSFTLLDTETGRTYYSPRKKELQQRAVGIAFPQTTAGRRRLPQDILDTLDANGPLLAREIAWRLNTSILRLSPELQALAKEGLVWHAVRGPLKGRWSPVRVTPEAVLDLLPTGRYGVPERLLAAALHTRPAQVRPALEALAAQGVVRPAGKWRWQRVA